MPTHESIHESIYDAKNRRRTNRSAPPDLSGGWRGMCAAFGVDPSIDPDPDPDPNDPPRDERDAIAAAEEYRSLVSHGGAASEVSS